MKITKCVGEGQGTCKRCSDMGKWNRTWMSFLYHIEGKTGCYCKKCVDELKAEENNSEIWINIADALEEGGINEY